MRPAPTWLVVCDDANPVAAADLDAALADLLLALERGEGSGSAPLRAPPGPAASTPSPPGSGRPARGPAEQSP